MADWERYYRDKVARLDRGDYFSQVGHTVNGQPIPPVHFDLLVEQISAELDLRAGDRLLDVCCGNGLITRRLAVKVRSVVGIDIAAGLIDIAASDHKEANTTYLRLDAREVESLKASGAEGFDKVLLYAALQHFTPDEFAPILDSLKALLASEGAIMLGFVPDAALIWNFYNTPQRRAEHLQRQADGTDTFGFWWPQPELDRMCRAQGLTCAFGRLPSAVHASTYRFNAVVRHSRQG